MRVCVLTIIWDPQIYISMKIKINLKPRKLVGVRIIVLNATFNNISAISW